MIPHCHRDLGRLVARRRTKVEDPVAGSRIEEKNGQERNLLLHVVESSEKPPMFARLGVLDEELESTWTPRERLQRNPMASLSGRVFSVFVQTAAGKGLESDC
jgi:hypothetical protein